MLETALFSIAPSDDLEFFLESSDGVIESSTLYFTRPSKLHYGVDKILLGSIEVIQGRIEDGLDDLLFESVRLEVGVLGGYQSDPFEDDVFGFSVKTTKDGVESSVSYALISTGFNYCIQLKFLKGFTEEDISDISRAIVDGTFKNYEGKGRFGDVLNLEFTGSQLSSSIGSRVLLHSSN
jgi:hypothetical protein